MCISGPPYLSSCHTDTSKISQQVHHFCLYSLSYLCSEASHHKMEGGGAPPVWCVRHTRPARVTLPPSATGMSAVIRLAVQVDWPGQGRSNV